MQLLEAMGLPDGTTEASIDGPDHVSSAQAGALQAQTEVGLWSQNTSMLYKLANPKTGFKDFFQPYDAFRLNLTLEMHGEEVIVCVPHHEDADLDRCHDVMNLQYSGSKIHFKCVAAADVEECLAGIRRGTYDITMAGGYELYTAHVKHALRPLLAEVYEGAEDTASYYGVGIVKADQCGPGRPFTGLNRESLQGKDSCHTGYHKSAGWMLPVGALLDQGIMPRVLDPEGQVNADAYSVSRFFNKVCAPRTVADGPTRTSGGTFWPLCELCADAGNEVAECDGDQDTNLYYGDTGAFKCMTEGNLRVAWVKHTTFDEYTKGSANDLSKSDYRILCTDGCFPLDEFSRPQCHTGQSASRTVVARPDYTDTNEGKAVKAALQDFRVAAMEIAGRKDFFWSFSTQSIKDVEQAEFENGFFGAFSRFDAIANLEATVRVCIASGTRAACERQLDAAYGGALRFRCQRVAPKERCLAEVAERNADVTVVGGDELFLANNMYGLSAYVAEGVARDADNAHCYGVAVVKESKCSAGAKFDKATLQGMRACSTGYRKTAGWVLPMAKILREFEGVLMSDPSGTVNTDAYSIGQFFKKGICAPRTVGDGPQKDGTNFDKLCAVCKTDQQACSDNDEYAGYDGALKCLLEDGGDVAFVKHTTADDEQLSLERKGSLKLLCSDGCRDWTIGNAKLPECTTGQSASNALVARKDYAGTKQLQDLLNALGFVDGAEESTELPGDVTKGTENGFWSSGTAKLFKVEDPQDFGSFFTAYQWFNFIRDLDKKTIRVCITSGSTDSCKAALHQAYGRRIKFECSKVATDEACLKAIKQGTADLTVVGGIELFLAHNQYDLAAYVAENAAPSISSGSYYGVAVVRSEKCDDGWQFDRASLEGTKVCSTGYRKTAGWMLPVGKLIAKEAIGTDEPPDNRVFTDAYNTGKFFGGACAPDHGTSPTTDRSKYEPLCSICKTTCKADDQYANYTGALQCMIDGTGDVAFVKHSTFEAYLSEVMSGDTKGRTVVSDKTNFKLLCEEGCKDWTDVNAQLDECSTGKSATNALVGRKDFVKSPQHGILMKALGFSSLRNLEVGIDAATFWSAAAAVKDKARVGFWSPDTAMLTRLLDPETDAGFKDFFSAYDNFKAIRDSDLPSEGEVRVCVPFDDRTLVSKCTEVMNMQYSSFPLTVDATEVTFKCYNGRSSEGCMRRIAEGTVDLTIFGGHELFLAHEQYGLKAYVAERADRSTTAAYYGVAVVKADQCGPGKAFTGFNRKSLQGKKSCHTGYRKTAGWVLPVGKMLKNGIMPLLQDPTGEANADAYSASQFFSKVCAPRTVIGGPSKDGSTYAPLCELCTEADGMTNPCAGDQGANPYYDFNGAFRCMDEGVGDVAFVKHTTREDYERENGISRPAEKYKILCDDGCKDYTDRTWRDDPKCITGTSATSAVVARPDFTESELGAAAIKSLINGGIVKVAAKAINGNRNFFWGMSTGSVVNVEGRAFNNEFFQAYESFKEIQNLDVLDDNEIRVCITHGFENRCQTVLNDAYGSSASGIRFSCTLASSDHECLGNVESGRQDITVVGGNELFLANAERNLVAYVAEVVDEDLGDASYFGVAAVKRSTCSGSNFAFNKATLQSLVACSTGYRKTAGWVLPVGKMLDGGIMPRRADPAGEVNADAFSMARFFRQGVCAPRTTADGPLAGGHGKHDELCTACNNDCSNGDEYYGYGGALKCMLDHDDRVAFVKHTTANDEGADKGDLQLLCSSGCQDWTDANAKSPACATGKSATNALVARKDFSMLKKIRLLKAMGLDKAETADVGARLSDRQRDALLDKSNLGFWNKETKQLKKLTATDGGFRDFFGAFDYFREIRVSENYLGDAVMSSNIRIQLSGVEDEILDGQSSNNLADRQKFNNWVGGVEDALEEMLKESCNEDGSSGCSTITVTVTSVTRVSSRRSLLASTVDVESHASGSSASNSKKVTDRIRSSRSITIGGTSYGASNAEATGLDTKIPSPIVTPSPSASSNGGGLHNGGVAGVAIGLFFAGVFITLIAVYIVYKKRAIPDCVQQSENSFRRMQEMKYNQYNNPASGALLAGGFYGVIQEDGADKP